MSPTNNKDVRGQEYLENGICIENMYIIQSNVLKIEDKNKNSMPFTKAGNIQYSVLASATKLLI